MVSSSLFYLFAALILWGSCLLVFIASPNQKFVTKRPNKLISWCIFVLFTVVSCLLLSSIYSMVIAIILCLALIITMWLAIIFLHAHCRLTLLPFAVLGAMTISSLVGLGEWYVV